MSTMLVLFCLGLTSVEALWFGGVPCAFVLLLAGYVAIFLLDPVAAPRGEAPLHVARLRQRQMPIIIVSLAQTSSNAGEEQQNSAAQERSGLQRD